MGFYFRAAPGVRVRLTSGGVRTSIGPRGARVHLGAGGAGVSTGAGPFTYYQRLPHSSAGRRSSGGGSRTYSGGTPLQQEKAAAAQQLNDEISAIAGLNHVDFPDHVRPVADPPAAVDFPTMQLARRREAKKQASIFKRKERKAALMQAEALARSDYAAATKTANDDRDKRQNDLDAWWARLEACEADTLLPALAKAFEDNQVPAAAVGVDGTEVSLLVVVPGVEVVPDRHPTTTAAGNLSLKRMTKTETADLYKAIVCGHTLLTVREAFSVAPALTAARVVTIRHAPTDVYGRSGPEVVLAGAFTRSALQGVKWQEVTALQVTHQCATDLMLSEKGAAKELQPIDLHDEPDMAAILRAVDVDELLAQSDS